MHIVHKNFRKKIRSRESSDSFMILRTESASLIILRGNPSRLLHGNLDTGKKIHTKNKFIELTIPRDSTGRKNKWNIKIV